MSNKNNDNLMSAPISGPAGIKNRQGLSTTRDMKGTSARYYLTDPGEYYVKMKATFKVPSIPKNITGNYWLYLWPGIQSKIGGVFQPVLAFSNTPVASWYLHTYAISPDGSGYVKGDDYDIPVGTDLIGVVELTNKTSDGLYTYKVYFEGYPEKTSCTQTWNHPPIYSYGIIEPWYVTDPNQFPQEGFLVMTNIELTTNKREIKNIEWESDNPDIITCANDKLVIPYLNGFD